MRNGHVQPGDAVVVVGAGQIGLAAVATAKLLSPAHIVVVDPAEPRREAAGRLGADVLRGSGDDAPATLAELTGGLGAGTCRTW